MKTAGKMEINLADWAEALEAALNGVIMRGKAELGDKTMVDALTPAVAALKQSILENQSIHKALELSADAAQKGMEGTTPLVARKGRASYLGERSAGHQDPGCDFLLPDPQGCSRCWKNVVAILCLAGQGFHGFDTLWMTCKRGPHTRHPPKIS